MAMTFRPRYITFDCYGTLINFQIHALTRALLADRLDAAPTSLFLPHFGAYRFDEALSPWKPYAEVIKTALRRCCQRWRVPYRETDGQQLYEAVPTWGPHPDVPAALATLAREFPLVILSNASDS